MIRLFKGKLFVSIFSVMLAGVAIFSEDAPFFFVAVLCALLHEASHVVAMRLFGVGIERISVYPFGVDIRASSEAVSYTSEAAFCLAGPIASIIFSGVSLLIFKAIPSIYVFSAFLINFSLFLVNILPVRGLDGGRALLSFLLSRLDYTLACRIFSAVSSLFFGILCLAAFYLIYLTGYNLSLVFICIYMFFSEYVKDKAL